MSNLLKDLFTAAGDNNIAAAKKVVVENADILKPNPKPNPPEGETVPYQELEIGDSPLMRAVSGNHLEMVRFLLDNGADPDEHHGYNYGLPLQKAVWENFSDIANLLLDYGADPSKSTAMADMEATGYSLFTGDRELINRVYAAGGRADIFAYIKANMLPVIGELLDHCPDVPANKPSVAGTRTILQAIRGEAAWCGNADALSMALAVRPVTNGQIKHHISAAIQSHNRLFPVESYIRCFSILLDAGDDVVNDDEFYPLHKLAQKRQIQGRIEFAKLFVQRGVDPGKRHHESGRTALELAIEHECDELIQYLKSFKNDN